MPYSRPTLLELRTRARQDIQAANLVGIDPALRFGVLPALTWALAGLTWSQYGYQDYIAKQAVPWTASGEWLYGWGAMKGVPIIDPAYSSGIITFTAPAGTVFPIGTPVNRSDGVTYTTTAAVTASGVGVAALPVAADVAGTDGNAAAGTTFVLALPIVGASNTGVSGVIQGGAPAETDDAYRTRMLAAWASPSQGGAASDYVEWALEVPGVTRAWAKPLGMGAGTVVVYTMMDVANANTGGYPQGTNGVGASETRAQPASGDQLTVANYLFSKRPATALVYSCAPIAQPVAFTITDLTPNTLTVQSAIKDALASLLAAVSAADGTSVLSPSAVYAAVSALPSVQRFTVSSPTAPVSAPVGSLFSVGPVTFFG